MEVFPAGDDRFFYGPHTLSWFEVKRDPAGKHTMSIHQDGSEEALTSIRIGPVPVGPPVVNLDRSVLERYVGRYMAMQGIANVALTEQGLLTIQLGRGKPVSLLAASPAEFRVDGGDARVVFHTEGGKLSHLVFHQGESEIRADLEPDPS